MIAAVGPSIAVRDSARLNCGASAHAAMMRDPARRQAGTHSPRPQTSGPLLLGHHLTCCCCGSHLFLPAVPPRAR